MNSRRFLVCCRGNRALTLVVFFGMLILVVGGWFWYRSTQLADLPTLRQGARLRVLTMPVIGVEDPVTQGLYELENRLIAGLADSLGTDIQRIYQSDPSLLLQRLKTGRAHLGMAALTVQSVSAQQLLHSLVYASSHLRVVYQRGSRRPRTPADLVGRVIAVPEGSNASSYLRNLQQQFPGLRWQETTKRGGQQLLFAVANGRLQTTIVDRNLLDIVRLLYPQLALGYEVEEPIQWVWAIPQADSADFKQVVNDYLYQAVSSGLVEALRDRLVGVPVRFDFVDTRAFHRAVASRLPELQKDFQLAGIKTGIDWRLLAAQAFQESHWDSSAVSATGARGLMQLTRAVADQFAVADPFDTWPAVLGGARYLRQLMTRLPATMVDTDRNWAALAAYNYGLKNIAKARARAKEKGRNPDYWVVLRDALLQPEAEVPEPVDPQRTNRARQAVRYVRRIRGYFRILSSPLMEKYVQDGIVSN